MATTTAASFTQDLQRVLGGDLSAVVMYGSAVGATGSVGANLLVLVRTLRPAALRELGEAVAGWQAAGHPPPLILTDAEWRSSRDVFAMEHADIAARHQVLAGTLPASSVSADDLRRQLEYEAMGALIHLRQGILACNADPKREIQLLLASKGTVLALLRALLRVHGEEAPASASVLVRTAAAKAGFDAGPFVELLDHIEGRPIPDSRADAVLTAYHAQLKKLVAHVDAMLHPDAPAVD